ncbi:MAG: glycogen debranching protein GlgX [Pirellulales bacterium]|nr:glycogen debranching protein GlgX [Pirellulales bacterium]
MLERPPSLKFNHPLPYGAICHDDGVQFIVVSRSATAMRVLIYDKVTDREPAEIVDFDPALNRWGDIWSVFVPGMTTGQLYHFQVNGPYDPDHGQRFDPKARLIDPYAKALAGHFLPADDGIIRPPKCVVIDDEFDWQNDRHIRRELSETIIYETHVRGFTQSKTSGVQYPGTYLGLIEKIPYLQSLGVTAVELMPVHEFPIHDCLGQKLERPNYWGYDPLAFFAPHRGYAVGDEPGAQVNQFKQMVLALHQAGIEVILDVVFNHTAEGNHEGPVLSFKGLENRVYYMLENGGATYKNYSGCGNTLNGNHPIVRELIFHCLRHWVHNYHIDGFRFDLASILSRDREGHLVPNPPVVENISEDPLLADTKIIAEAWDAAGAYQVGTFGQLRWAEWNGRYRDDVRRYWRGDPNMNGAMATRLAGSSDLYQPGGRRPYHSINFIISHDGFTLNDLVSYNHKHNEANGEGNADGENNNYSCNYGVEGPTLRRSIDRVRVRQIKNMFATLLLSQGAPMLAAGDECRRTQRGNNNAYCQDNDISWFDWRLARKQASLRRFVETLIAFRCAEPTVRQTNFLSGQPVRPGGLPDVSWYNAHGMPVDWEQNDASLICLLAAVPRKDATVPPNHHVLLLCHAGDQPRAFTLPPITKTIRWQTLLNTAARSPEDIYPELDGPPPPGDGIVEMESRSMVCFVASDTW